MFAQQTFPKHFFPNLCKFNGESSNATPIFPENPGGFHNPQGTLPNELHMLLPLVPAVLC